MAALNRSMKYAEVYELAVEYDEYGTKKTYEASGACHIFITLYSQNKTDDARYKDVTHVGISDIALSESMCIVQDGKTYKIQLVNNHARRNVVYLQEVI